MVFGSKLDLYLQNLRKVCNILDLSVDIKYQGESLLVRLDHIKKTLQYTVTPESVEGDLRKLLYNEMEYHEYTKKLLNDIEVKLTTLDTLPVLIDKLYTKNFIEYLRQSLYSLKKKGQRSLQIEMQTGIKYFITDMRNGKADVYVEKDLLETGVPFQSIIPVINKSLGTDNKVIDVLVNDFIHRLRVTDWVEDSYDKYTKTTILNTESYGTVYLTRLSSLLYVIRSDFSLPMLVDVNNFNSAVASLTPPNESQPMLNRVSDRFMELITELLGTDFHYKNNVIYKNDESYITRVGRILSTPQVSYQIDNQYRAMLQVMRRIVTQKRRGYKEI